MQILAAFLIQNRLMAGWRLQQCQSRRSRQLARFLYVCSVRYSGSLVAYGSLCRQCCKSVCFSCTRILLTGLCVMCVRAFLSMQLSRKCPSEVVCLCCGCLCSIAWICVCVCVLLCCVFVSVRAFLSVCLVLSQGRNSGGRSLQRERDRGRLEFSGVCLRLGPLLNEECSILLIMLLWLMSLSADSGECNKTRLLFGLFAFLIGLNKRAFRSSSPAIHIRGSGWHLCVFLAHFHVCICVHASLFCYLGVCVWLCFQSSIWEPSHCFIWWSSSAVSKLWENTLPHCSFYSFNCHESFW